jgi:hypothetical protein
MPYIPPETRNAVPAFGPQTGGELAYLITVELDQYMTSGREINYDKLTEVRGALAAASSEFERRVAEPYEARKLRENGDVFSPDLLHFVQNG